MTNQDRMTATERRAVLSLSSLYIFRMLGLFLVLPVLAVYAPQYKGSTPQLVGLALGIYGLSQACLQIPLGLLSDRIGRKPVIFLGLLSFAAGSVLAASADTIWGLLVGRFLQGAGAIASTLTALMADLTRDQHRSKAMAGIGASIGLAFAVAMILGPVISAQMGLSGLFWGTAVMACVGIGIVWLAVPTASAMTRSAEARSLPSMMRRCLSDPDLLRLNLGVFSLHLMLTAMFVTIPTYFERQGIPVAQHWHIYLPILVLSFVVMVPMMIAAEKRGKAKSIVLGSVATLASSTLVMALMSRSLSWFVVALTIFFVAFNLLEANLPSLLSKTVYPGGRGTAMGIFSTFQFLGAFIGGSASGVLKADWGLAGVLLFCSGAAFIWLIAIRNMRIPESQPNLAVDIGQDPQHRSSVLNKLRDWPDVVDITVIAGEPIIYVKVSKDFDRSQLDALTA